MRSPGELGVHRQHVRQPTRRAAVTIRLVIVLAIAAGCGNDSAPSAACPPAASPLRRLSHFEYNNTVRDLLGDTTRPADAFPPEDTMLGFKDIADAQTVGELLAEYYMNAAEAVAHRAVADLPGLLGCAPSASCVDGFVRAFGRRAYRRPLDPGEVQALTELYAAVAGQLDAAAGVEAVLQAVLQSPHFLYRIELGGGSASSGAVVPVTQLELATRLASLLWASTPDDALLDAAEHGELATVGQIEAMARRMLDDPRARQATGEFDRQWLELTKLDTLSKDPAAYPAFDAALAAAWKQETEAFVDHVIWE